MKTKVKSYKDVLGYEPSEYQNKIFDFIVHGSGNCVIKARAGSGKSATIIASMKLVPNNKKCLFLAFNKSVKEEIEKKIDCYDNCTVKTIHGLGYMLLSDHIKNKVEIDEYKYSTFLKKNITQLSKYKINTQKRVNDFCDNIIQLLNFSRINLAQSEKEIRKISQQYGITTECDEVSVVKTLMKWGKENLDTVDYTDLVWLPYELDINPKQYKYDWIFNDEAQDYSISYVKLFTRCFKRGTRFVSCGDEFQSINQFAGASSKAFDMMINMPNTQVFELPISYRCDKTIIDEANRFVPDIMPRNGAGLGIVKYESSIKDINDTDIVLARTNAELYKIYPKLIGMGKPCYIKGGNDDKNKLISIINRYNVNNELSKKFESDGLFPQLYDKMISDRNDMVENGMDLMDAINSQPIQSKYDIISSLDILSVGCSNVTELIDKINNIFSNTDNGICLSTIHKAKGLESDNVHILCRSTMPKKSAKTQDEIQQELNIIYVAITRAKHRLNFVSEKEFPPIRENINDNSVLTEFNYIESMVCKLYGKEPLKVIKDAEISRFKLISATKIETVHKNDNKKVISPQKKTSGGLKNSLLDNLLKK